MRHLKSHSKEPAEQELRADEHLVPAGNVMGFDLFAATNDEDYMPKEAKLNYRRQQRKRKREQGERRD